MVSPITGLIITPVIPVVDSERPSPFGSGRMPHTIIQTVPKHLAQLLHERLIPDLGETLEQTPVPEGLLGSNPN